jgi:hypothetical protein
VKSGRGGRTPGLESFRARYQDARILVVGDQGIPLQEFFGTTAEVWLRGERVSRGLLYCRYRGVKYRTNIFRAVSWGDDFKYIRWAGEYETLILLQKDYNDLQDIELCS